MESLQNNYFKTILRVIDDASSLDQMETRFHPPKLAIITGTKLRVIDIDSDDESDITHELEAQVNHIHQHKNYLWLMLDSCSQLLIYNLTTAASVKLNFQNSSFHVKKLRESDENIILVSESGDCFTTDICMSKLIELSKPEQEISVDARFVKVKCDMASLTADCPHVGGTFLTLQRCNVHELVARCTVTSLEVMMNFDEEVTSFATFCDNDRLVLQLKNKLTDTSDLVLIRIASNEQETRIEASGHLVGGVGNAFYYVSLNEEKINVNCVKRQEPLHVARALASCGKYDEAHDYALKNQLDVEPLLKMKLTGLTDGVLAGENVDISIFCEIFQQITDIEFLTDQTLKLCQHNVVYKPLALMLNKRCGEKGLHVDKLSIIITKIEILEFIDVRGGCEHINLKDIFHESLDYLCLKFVSNSDVDIAAVVWLKRCAVIKEIDSHVAQEILNATPQLIKLNALMVWLTTFLPVFLHENPFFIDSIVKWATDRVFSLEKSKYWPDIGLKFTEDILKVLKESCFTTTNVYPPLIDSLHLITMHMKTIKHLKEKYRVNILIRELTVESPAEIVKIILHRCYTEDLKSLMKEYLPSYTSRHGLDYDTLLREYVNRLMVASAVDDARLPQVVQAMYSNEQRVACVLHVVENIEVPWSNSVYQLAIEAAASNHESSNQIKIQMKYAKLKLVLKKYNFPLTCSDYESLLIKIVNATTIEIEDIKTVIEVAVRLKDYACFLYINRCLHVSDVKSALEYCNDLEKPEKKTVCRSIMIYLESLLMDESHNLIIQRNYLDFLKSVNVLNETQLINIDKMYHLKNTFQVFVPANDYCIEAKRMETFTEWCELNGSVLASNVFYLKSLNLAALLKIEKRTAVPIVVAHMKDKFYCSTLQAMLRISDNLLLENVIDNFDLSVFLDGKQNELLESYIEMFTEFATTCQEDLLHNTLVVLSIFVAIKNSNYFVDNSSIAWKFHYIFMPVSTYSSMNELTSFYKRLNAADPKSLISLIMPRNDLVPLRMISEISNRYTSNQQPIPNEFIEIREKIAKQMLVKILLSQHCDELLVTSLLYMIPAPDDWLRDLYDTQSSENTKTSLLNFMVLAEKMLAFRDLVPHTATGYHQMLKSKHNLDITDYVCADETYETTNMKSVLFTILKTNPKMDTECLQDVCRTFKMSFNDALTLQIIQLISTWNLKYCTYRDSYNCKQIDIQNDEKDLESQCCVLLESIKNKEFLIESLKELWVNAEIYLEGQTISLNPYHYEVFLCIYSLLSRVTSDWKPFKEYLLLQFLKQYQRVTSPRQTEMDLFSVKGSFPEIGYYRLPFHMFTKEDMWLNLKYEITLQSYSRWLPIVTILRLDKDVQTAKDMLCSTAVKQTMTQQSLDNNSTSEQWKLFVTNEGLLKEAHECVQHISNMEWAAACLFFVLQGTKRGADQLAAAELTYQFAQQWSKLQPNNNAVTKMQYKYCTLNTMHILHKMGFTEERFLKLCTDAGNLIKTLYGDQRYNENMLEFDVNKFIDEIADKNGVNIIAMRYQILENILERKSKRVDDHRSIGLSGSELAKARYILKATCPNAAALYLLRIGLDTDTDFNKGKKLRALQCLMNIVDPETLYKISNMDRPALQTALLDLYFTIELERIDMPFLVATFIEDKQRALRQIWQSGEKTAETLRVVASMSTVYSLDDNIAQELLVELIRCDLVEELGQVLLHVQCTQTPVYAKAWSKVLLTPFEKADHPVTVRQRKKCLDAINLLPRCPVINESDLTNIWKNCTRSKCLDLGCLVLPYMNSELRSVITDWSKVDRRHFIAGIKNLHADTFLVIAAMSVVDSLTSRKC